MKNLSDLLLLLLLALYLDACQQSTLVGSNLIDEDNTQVQEIDTLRVETASLLLDSVYTADGNRLLAGSYIDPYLGTVQSQCFFNVDTLGTFSIDDDDNLRYDSLSVSLRYEYQYPATDQVQRLSLYTLDTELEDEKLYFNHSAAIPTRQKIATLRFNTRTTRNKRFSTRLDDGLGRLLFQVAKGQNGLDLDQVIQGLSLQQEGSAAGQSVMGFATDSLEIQLHYRDQKTKEAGRIELRLKPGRRFNRIGSERSQTALRNLVQRGVPLAATQSKAETYIQAGVGICTQVEFPTLRSLRQNRSISIHLAYLDFELPKASYQGSDFDPLENLYVYTPTHKNTLRLPYWAGSEANPVSIRLSVNPLTGNSRYRVYLTDYVHDVLNQDDEDYRGILLYVPASSTGINEVGRVVLAGQGHAQGRAKLNVIFTVIK